MRDLKASVKIIDKATKPLRKINQAFKNIKNTASKSSKSLGMLQNSINSISKAQNRIGRMGANLKKQSAGIQSNVIGVAAMGYAFKQILDPAIKYEQSLKDIESVAFGSADASVPVAENMKKLSEQSKSLGATTRYSAVEAAEGQLFLAKAGFKTNEILSAMSPLLSLAAATGSELGRASDITSDLLGAFGKKAKDTGKLADLLAAASSSANVDMETLFETLKDAAPIGTAAGQSMEGIVTATALLGNVGIKGSQAGTALKNAYVRLASPASAGAKVLKKLGIQVADTNGNMLPLETTLSNMGKKMKDLSQTQKIQALDAIFGKRAMAGAINLEKAVNSGDFESMLTKLSSAEGTADKMAKIRMDSTEGAFIELGSALEGVAIVFGTVLTPLLRDFATNIKNVLGPVGDFIKNNQWLVSTLGLLATAFIAGKLIAITYGATMWLVGSAVSAFSTILKVAKIAMIAFNFALSANPIGLIITSIATLVAGLVWAYNEFETFANFVDGMFAKILSAYNYVKEALGFSGTVNLKVASNKQQNSAINPAAAIQNINNQNNNKIALTVNNENGRFKSIEAKNTQIESFVNNGVQE